MENKEEQAQATLDGQADVLIAGATVVTLNPAREILRDASIVIKGNRIVAVESDPSRAASWKAKRVIDGANKTVFPGLINTHTHMFQTLLKGLADDMEKKDWVQKVASRSSGFVNEDDCYVAALLGCVEGLRTGTTTVLDYMYAHPQPFLSDAVIRAFRETGIRGIFGRGYNNTGVENGLPPQAVQLVEVVKEDIERLIEAYNGSENGRILVWVAPNTIWGQTREGLLMGKELSERYGVGMTMHISETPWETECAQRMFGMTDLALVDSLGLLGHGFMAVHCVNLDARGVRILKMRNVSVSHNTIANMYLASGEAPVPEMLMGGVTVALGTDGAASNNNMNMVQLLKFTALLHKVMRQDPTVITAEKVLEMATIDGAKALMLDADLGSIEVGKKADLILMDFRTPNTTPDHHPVSTLVYSASGSEVQTVLVDGRVVVDEGKLCTVDEAEVLKEATRRAKDLAKRAGTEHLARREWRSMTV